jgi:hypothetical protein
MKSLLNMFSIARSKTDPKVISSGPSSLTTPDKLAKALGYFSLGLGLMELVAPKRVTRFLGMEGQEGLVRAYGLREIGAGVLSLSIDKQVGLWSRVGGDGIDILTLAKGYTAENPQRRNVAIALGLVIGITALDIIGAQSVTAVHARDEKNWRDYSDRSGFPKGRPGRANAAKPKTVNGNLPLAAKAQPTAEASRAPH